MFKFIKTKDKSNSYDEADIVYRIKNTEMTWPDLVSHFICFLRGCQFYIDDGEFVEDKKIHEYLDLEAKKAIETLIEDADKSGRLNEYLIHPNALIRTIATTYKQKENEE